MEQTASAGISTSGDTQGRAPPIDCPPQINPNHGPNFPQTTIHQSQLNPKTSAVTKPVQQNPMLQILTSSSRPMVVHYHRSIAHPETTPAMASKLTNDGVNRAETKAAAHGGGRFEVEERGQRREKE
ncbi:Hypothetical predicted protein [Olea europaea subsp. europaea]|uniref:Uncharacterized protein n=1 Tax=Olea europaea subsp. europaea TaxID=158383 RepID=A0A8S0T4M5_OLEEU|nr:Hypothetical predicted protein [Olea europaea subsp. europaea]